MVKYTEEYKKERINLLISNIKKKKEFSGIDDQFVRDLIHKKLNNRELENIYNHNKPEKSKEFKNSVKLIRKILHETYGVFNLSRKRIKLLNQLKEEIKKTNKINGPTIDFHIKLLKTHKSTNERVDYYNEIYGRIFSTIKPEIILDLSAGLNPLSYPWMGLNKVKYIATELTNEDTEFLDEYFKSMAKFGLDGKTLNLNLLKTQEFPKSDICFLLKTLDSLETLKKGISESIINNIDTKLLIISFPTKTLSGKTINKKRLAWFNKLISNYSTFEIKNEIFYIIDKKLY
ncbi:hypothetical protein HYX15_03290 [Candidatus Woesearchaeota archaeon]|nr:hypothetical protein [Candidatus Woesearchaeota archaeon]